jgi:hypothetical protein
MKLKKRLQLLEEFQTGISSSNTKTTSPVSKTVDTVETRPTQSKTSADARAEVINDVDGILKNLEKLSSQIAEDIFAESNLDLDTLVAESGVLNEAGGSFIEQMMAAIKAMKNFAVLKASYPALKKAVAEKNVEKEEELASFDMDSKETEEKAIEQLKAKWQEKIEQAREQFKDNPGKKTAAMAKLRDMRDKSIEGAKGGAIKTKIDGARQQKAATLDAETKKEADKLAELEANYKLDGSETLSKQWQLAKNKIDLEVGNWEIEAKTEVKVKYSPDDPDAIKKAEEKAAADSKKKEAEAKERAAELQQDLKDAEAKMAAKEADAMNDPDKKDAVIAVKEFYKTSQEYINTLSSVEIDDDGKVSDEGKKAMLDTRKAYNAAKDKLSPSKLVKAGEAENKEQADEMVVTLTDAVDNAVKQYDDKLKAADTAAANQKSAIKDQIKELKDEVTSLEGDVETKADPEEKKTAQIAVLNKKIEVENKNKELAALEDKDVASYDEKIAQLQQQISDIENGTPSNSGNNEKTSQQLADEFIADNDGFKVVSAEEKDAKVTVRNAETEQDEEKPKYEGQKDFKGKKEDGSDDDVVWVAKEISYTQNASVNVPAGTPITESFGFQSASIADRFRNLM